MTAKYEDRVFYRLEDRRDWPWQRARTIECMEFVRCLFDGCVLSATRDPRKRTIIRNMQLVDCVTNGSRIYAAIVEDTELDGLNTRQLLQTWGAAFKHVALKGRIGRLMISDLALPTTGRPSEQLAFAQANRAYYGSVDWALDISSAEFREIEIRGVPANLIRRDPESQIVIRRENLLDGRWSRLNLPDPYWAISINIFLKDTSYPDHVLAAPKSDPNFAKFLQSIRILREAGVAEPD